MIKNKEGKIIQIDRTENLYKGDSVCNFCKKDMPICWDVWCGKCEHTFCYNCSVFVDMRWLCFNCAEVEEKEKAVNKILSYQ